MATPAIKSFQKLGTFYKAADGVAYGWALASTYKGAPYFDTGDGTHSDHIPEESLAAVTAQFMAETGGAALDMHTGDRVADVVFALPLTSDVAKIGLGIRDVGDVTGLAIGWRPHSVELLDKIARGERIGFSIGGSVDAWDIVDRDGKVVESVDLSSVGKSERFDAARSALAKQAASGYFDGGSQLLRVFRSWKLGEISTVDRPMMRPALVGLVKGARPESLPWVAGAVPRECRKVQVIARVVAKSAILTSIEDGHQHTLDPMDCCDGDDARTSWESASGADYGHDHAIVRDAATGAIQISMNEGHTHIVDAEAASAAITGTASTANVVAMRALAAPNLPTSRKTRSVGREEIEMADNKDDKTADALVATTKQRDGWRTMTDAHRAHLAKLSAAEQDAFVLSTPSERNTTIKSALDADPVVYESKRLGKSFRASEQAMADVVKDSDAQALELAKARDERDIAKAAAIGKSLGPIPLQVDATKSIDDRLALAKAIMSITDDAVRGRVIDALKAAGTALDAESIADGREIDDDADGEGLTDLDDDEDATPAPTNKGGAKVNPFRPKLAKLAREYAKTNKIASKEVAMADLLKNDDEAKQLYADVSAWDRRHRPSAH